MGLEARCRTRVGDDEFASKARLEDKALLVRGRVRVDIPLSDIRHVDAEKGWLHVRHSSGTTSLNLGPDAEKWALKIRYPRPLIDKLGVKNGSRVVSINVDDAGLTAQLQTRGAAVLPAGTKSNIDVIFFQPGTSAQLSRLKQMRTRIAPAGAIWVVWRKGQSALGQMHVMQAAKAAALVDVKVVAFSETHSALKLMIPRAQRV